MNKNIGIQRRASDVMQGPTLKVSNEQALQMLRTKMAQRLSSQASGGELRRSFELLDRDKSGNVELAELEEASANCTPALAHVCSAIVSRSPHHEPCAGFPTIQHQLAGQPNAELDAGVRCRRQRPHRLPGVHRQRASGELQRVQIKKTTLSSNVSFCCHLTTLAQPTVNEQDSLLRSVAKGQGSERRFAT
jgi:hypothetical protein